MKDYASMSDFEINCSVARALGEVFTVPPKGKSNPYLDVTDTTISLLNCDGTRVERALVKDFCNNPADAWPIISAEFISIEADYEREVWRAGFNGCYSYVCRNALRAAMIVFLMMKEGE